MGLFSKKGSSASGSLQYPDELAQDAALAYGTANFSTALDTYALAIDKIHTMCVVASPSSRLRTPGPQDQPILDGFVSSLGAGLAMDATMDTSIVAKTLEYLRQIADEAGPEAGRYQAAITAAARTLP